LATAADNCTASPTITQDPVAGTMVGVGVTVITMTATDEAGNEATCTFEVTVDELLGVGESDLSNYIVLYPNPTQGSLTLVNGTTTELLSVVITDVNGRTIQTIDLSNSGMNTELSVDALATGMYFVQIHTATTSIVKRIIKQ